MKSLGEEVKGMRYSTITELFYTFFTNPGLSFCLREIIAPPSLINRKFQPGKKISNPSTINTPKSLLECVV
jgi:hypothetical protein